jgi:D-sedoheptulose 7-phosphate isomerase
MKKLITRYPSLASVAKELESALELLTEMFKNGRKLLLCGNGGSAADCDHIVGELMKSFKMKRPIAPIFKEKLENLGKDGAYLAQTLEAGFPAISLCEHNSLSTAFANDRVSDAVFAQQLSVLGNKGDVLLALTTSGNSRNCVLAAPAAKAMGLSVISITGQGGGRIAELSDVAIKLPETETYLVQELTLPVYHYICAEIENRFFS